MYDGQDEQSQQNEQPDLGSLEVEELDSEISSSELREAIFSQKNGKICGLDQLCAELFKHSFDIISPFLLKYYPFVLEWRISKIVGRGYYSSDI